MAQESSAAPTKAPWTKIFTAFKVALDLKKLALAAVGILFVWIGWWFLSLAFYEARRFPEWKDYEKADKPDERTLQWDYFKYKRAAWNLIHELAGSYDEKKPVKMDAADLANSLDEFKLLNSWEEAYKRINEPIEIKEVDKDLVLQTKSAELKSHTFTLSPGDEIAKTELPKLKEKKLTVASLHIPLAGDKAARIVVIDGINVKVDGPVDKLKLYRDGAWTMDQIAAKAEHAKANASFDKFKTQLVNPRPKVAGLMRVSPWFENRGGNPYLIVAGAVKSRGDSLVGNGQFATTFVRDDVPVLLEPLYKLLLPIVYLFDQRASAFDRLYLILAMLWTLVVWGFFGGAICRIAAVQVARNERITLREAVAFTRERFVSYIAAPVFPLVLVGMLTLCLMIFGWVEWIPYFIGDVFAGLLWPIVILLGFIMTIVLVGLVGWPLMVATISTEGTDSFDAMSRSYSYVYQAPWQYLWYSFVSIIYGAAVVFFIGFMASMMVFMGKWGVSSAVGLANNNPKFDRDPSYLFYYAPTSFGWRDVMISSNAFVEKKTAIAYDGRAVTSIEFKEEYEKELQPWEKTGAFLVSIWIYPLFLLVVGFGYSFFWSASTIVYFLMRRHVDDTEMDEVHMEDEDMNDPFLKQPPPSPAPAAAPPADNKPGTVSLNLVDAPPSSTAYTTNEPTPPPAPTNPPPENPPSP